MIKELNTFVKAKKSIVVLKERSNCESDELTINADDKETTP